MRVSLWKPNKRYSIKKEDLAERLQDYLKNVWSIRRYFIEKCGVDPPVINGDRMPLHRNESSCQKTVNFKGEETFVKENHMKLAFVDAWRSLKRRIKKTESDVVEESERGEADSQESGKERNLFDTLCN